MNFDIFNNKKCISEICKNKTLYIVPTPIGNLQDITYRALSILCQVNYIIAENIRRTKILLNSFSIRTPLYIMNRYNENIKVPALIEKLQQGYNMALVSDAGSPLINDPGYRLVQSCHKKKIKVVSLPGPCAAIAALCSSGLPTNRFCFEGFLPTKKSARVDRLKLLLEESRTLIFYDVKYRIVDSLKDMLNTFGGERYIVLVRELSKIWESVYGAPVSQLLDWVQQDKTRIQGEMVLIVSGYYAKKNDILSPKMMHTMRLLALEMSVKKAAIVAGKIYNFKKNIFYKKYLNEKINKMMLDE
ncbi:Tetrapyrrole (Corrin/Porphyrin) Methylases [Candidatus Blochmanniella floridana]|uniref:Ribosomal RNA small subunit methyltransferase I n=1 Tax=Blochmanniella floridana TaxID=203907 RepID=Q7VQR4_BLOFL|nr:Tetrapyrrole (Corrin/Porphyrin) Methylases [Candidatus Blochmannia floridanus]